MLLALPYLPLPVKLAPANLTSTGPGANFRGANLTGTAGGQLPNTYLYGNKEANLASTAWGANLRGIHLTNPFGEPF